MEAKIQRYIIDYFSLFEEFNNKTKSCLKDCYKSAIAINKCLTKLRLIKIAEIKGSPLEEFEGIQAILCTKIHNLVSEEVGVIKLLQSEIEEGFEALCIKQNLLTSTCKETNWEELPSLVSGSPLQPPLKTLIQYSEDTITFGSEICALIESALNVLNIKLENTEAFKDNFQISPHWQSKVTEIISYTSFCSKNQL